MDDQLYFDQNNPVGKTGLGNVVVLPTIGTVANQGNLPYVRYNNVAWTNTLGGTYDTAQARYEMAAYLVSQYNSEGITFSETNIPGDSSSYNTAVQNAIWSLTSNLGSPNQTGQQHVLPTSPTDEINLLIGQAETAYTTQTFDFSNWAVVSWTVDAHGNIQNGQSEDDTNGARQTFLVQIDGAGSNHIESTPEPGFYGTLALGLSGLIFSLSRRKKVA